MLQKFKKKQFLYNCKKKLINLNSDNRENLSY